MACDNTNIPIIREAISLLHHNGIHTNVEKEIEDPKLLDISLQKGEELSEKEAE